MGMGILVGQNRQRNHLYLTLGLSQNQCCEDYRETDVLMAILRKTKISNPKCRK